MILSGRGIRMRLIFQTGLLALMGTLVLGAGQALATSSFAACEAVLTALGLKRQALRRAH